MKRSDRRGARRISLQVPLAMYVDNAKLSCRMVNLSTTGLAVACPVQLQTPPIVRVVFRLPTTGQRLVANVRLVRQTVTLRRAGDGLPSAIPSRQIGMQFLNLSLQQQAAISRLVESAVSQPERLDVSNDNQGLTRLYREALLQLEGTK